MTMKRITCLLLAMVLLFGTVSAGVFTASAESAMRTSDQCIAIIKEDEGFCRYPIWDYSQWSVGYGTRCPSDMLDEYKQNGITEAAADTLLRNSLISIEHELNTRMIDHYGLSLSQNQFDALVRFSYNCGTRWTRETDGTFHSAIRDGATGNDLIRAFALWCSAGGEIKNFLLWRRLSEANMYLNGIYDKHRPDNYCYIIYDANGGFSTPRSQGYDSNLTAKPYPVPTYEGYQFDGWYTERSGGTKVEVLDASTKDMVLYAHWKDAEGNAPSVEQISVKITVTGMDVNLRNGPGTNYQRTGSVNRGDTLTVTETAKGGSYQWGKTEKGWIALQYTNFDEASKEPQPTEPAATEAATEPAPTETEATEAATEPETTEAPTAAPETTEATEPETTAPAETKPQTLTGKVTGVQEWLRIRSGPGTGYEVAGYLKPNEKVEILEKKNAGSMIWGRISRGWVSMDYITLDQPGSSGGESSTGGQAGTVVNCTQLRIRSGPSTGYSIVGYLNVGTQVSITEKTTTGSMQWGKIPQGWISLDYVQLSGNTDAAAKRTGTVNVQEWLRIRTGPGTSYTVSGYMKPQEKVEISEQRTAGGITWGKTAKGWISMDYVILDPIAETPAETTTPAEPEETTVPSETAVPSESTEPTQAPLTGVKTIVADCLRIRSDAGIENNIVGFLYYGAKAEVLETKADATGMVWGRISQGWISMDYAK